MTRRVVYVVGVPGSGKTTAVDAATAHLDPLDLAEPLPHRAWLDPTDGWRLRVVTLGRDRRPYGGTDTLGMAVQPRAVEWLTSAAAPPVVLAEGDRLGNPSFFDALAAAGVALTVVWLDTPPAVAQARRDGRGSTQNPSWIAGRATKVSRIVERYAPVRLDGTAPPAVLGGALLGLLDASVVEVGR